MSSALQAPSSRRKPRSRKRGKQMVPARGVGRRTRENTYLEPICELLSETEGDGAEGSFNEGDLETPLEGLVEDDELTELTMMGMWEEDSPQPPAGVTANTTEASATTTSAKLKSSKKKGGKKGRLSNMAAVFEEAAAREAEQVAHRQLESNQREKTVSENRAIPMAVPGKRSVGLEEAELLQEELGRQVETMEEQIAMCMSAGSFDAIKDELEAFLEESTDTSGSGDDIALSGSPSDSIKSTNVSSPACIKPERGFERENLLDGPTDEEYYACEVFLDATSKVQHVAAQRCREIERLKEQAGRSGSPGGSCGEMDSLSRSVAHVTSGLALISGLGGSARKADRREVELDGDVSSSSLPAWSQLSTEVSPEALKRRLESLAEPPESKQEEGYHTVQHPSTSEIIEVFAVEVDLKLLPTTFVNLVESLCVGMGFKGGVARKVLKLLNGVQTEMEGVDVDLVLTIDRLDSSPASMKVESECKQKALSQLQSIDGRELCPEDMEVLSLGSLHGYYWRTRDVTMNECLLLRTAPDALQLFFSKAAQEDILTGVVRCMPHCLKSHYCFMWRCDKVGTPILTSVLFERCLVRYLKGQGKEYGIDEATWSFYRRTKLSPTSVFRIMKNFSDEPEKIAKAVSHLKELDLVGSVNEVNLLWNQKAEEIKRGGAVDLKRKMTVGDCERWAMKKKEQMVRMRTNLQARAPVVGFVEGTRMAAVKIPSDLRCFCSPMFLHNEKSVERAKY